MTINIRLSEVRVPQRHRKDLGDLDSLKNSMASIGLLHPIVVDVHFQLVAGERRLSAAEALGWTTITARIVDGLDDAIRALTAERDENTCRKDFLPSEAVALARELEPLEREAAKERQREGGRAGGKASGKLPEAAFTGERREKIAAAVGVSRRTLDKAEAVVEAAEAEPEKYARYVEQMDRTGNVHGTYTQLEQGPNRSAIERLQRRSVRDIVRGEGKRPRRAPAFTLDPLTQALSDICKQTKLKTAATLIRELKRQYDRDHTGIDCELVEELERVRAWFDDVIEGLKPLVVSCSTKG